ncbi:hypothetical protein AC578_2583 [Pseudocercospora eumusae]|uniref:Uncharacterized protein n=1 Tax=Pseudocercospora eumusae TaxID=321146 RepID=A0A139GYP2_9PEZI|nr:hypothetical protein AC578_2583 [Pseudocercospora eumusae]
MDSDSDALSDVEMVQSFPDMPQYLASQVHSSRHLDPSILELDVAEAVALGLPAVPLQRLTHDDEFRQLEMDLFRLAILSETISNSLDSEARLQADPEVEDAIDDPQELMIGTRQDSVIKGSEKRQYVEIVDEPEKHDANPNDIGTALMKRLKPVMAALSSSRLEIRTFAMETPSWSLPLHMLMKEHLATMRHALRKTQSLDLDAWTDSRAPASAPAFVRSHDVRSALQRLTGKDQVEVASMEGEILGTGQLVFHDENLSDDGEFF